MDIKSRASNLCITAVTLTLISIPFFILSHESVAVGQIQSTFASLRSMVGAPELGPKVIIQEKDIALEDVLAQASMGNKTVIITTLNQAWAANDTMIDLYLQSFHLGEKIGELLNHIVIVSLDQKAHDRCLQLHPHCFRLKTSAVDFSREKKFMSVDYLKMMWRRIDFLREVLELGYSFLFSDADIVWFRDPFVRFIDSVDVQIACDHYGGNPLEKSKNSPNGGFLYVRSNPQSIAMYKYWYAARLRNPGKHDQHVLNTILREQDFITIGVKFRFLDTVYFSGFCEQSRDMTKVVTMHANCCIGLRNKLIDLHLVLDDWSLYQRNKSATPHKPLWRAPLACRGML